MKKLFRNLIAGVFIFACYFLSVEVQASANTINSIDMDVYIDGYGNATITEVWETNLDRGTEGYRPYTKMGNSVVSDFSVVDETGTLYEYISSWNTGAPFEEKAYKNGVHHISDGVELCWGISQYGNKTYTLKYNISNFVTKYVDKQGIYFNFINLDQQVNHAKIRIHSDVPFSVENAKIWAFGNNGTIQFEDGAIVLDSVSSLSVAQYMVALVGFETDIFQTGNISEKTFDEVYESAMTGITEADKQEDTTDDVFEHLEKKSSTFAIVIAMFGVFLWVLVPIVVVMILTKVVIKLTARSVAEYTDFLDKGKPLPGKHNIPYWREIPCEKDLGRAYWLAYNYNIVNKEKIKENIVGSILLKWVKDGKITIKETKEGLFSLGDNNFAIDFSNMTSAGNIMENELYEMLILASGGNNILEAKEFEKWCKSNYSKMESWLNYRLGTWKQCELERQGLIAKEEKIEQRLFGSQKTRTIYRILEPLREEAIQLAGLKKFLLEFSRISEKEYMEVHIWEEYLVLAQLFGIADKVEEQFEKLYPNYSSLSGIRMANATIAVQNMARIGYRSYQRGSRRAERRRSYSGSGSSRSSRTRRSGGGGRSYRRGGRSSGGSSGGGFR